jgi:hypothetical protein
VEFWADSSYGDASEIYTAQIRVIPWGDFANPDNPSVDRPTYYVDVLSSQWLGEGKSTCSDIWQSFMPIDGPPAWLRTPVLAEQLETDNEYYLLAGMLIKQGMVDASDCPAGGLEEMGQPQFVEWKPPNRWWTIGRTNLMLKLSRWLTERHPGTVDEEHL